MSFEFGGHKYELVNSETSWWGAKEAAEAKGGHLATINSAEELAACAEAAEKNGLVFVWLNATNGDWEYGTWRNGDSFDYAPWYPGEPSGDGEEYLCMFRVDGEWYFNDVTETISEYSGKQGYIIEIS